MFVGVSLIISIYWLINLLFIHFICACCFSLCNYIVIESPILICLYLSYQEPTSSYWCVLWLWESKYQHTVNVFCGRCDDWRGGVRSSWHTVHKDMEDTEHGWVFSCSGCRYEEAEHLCFMLLTDCNSKQHILQLRLIYYGIFWDDLNACLILYVFSSHFEQ